MTDSEIGGYRMVQTAKVYELDPQQMAWMDYNARLQQKKNTLRKALKDKGILRRGATNEYDKYSYFSEAQYKELFTELFSACGLELKFNEIEYQPFEGSEKQANGRMVRIEFTLFDCDTGFYESSAITGEGIDKGDKAGYKAYTGALKYYLADTFMVATGDDPEKDSPAHRMNSKTERKASPKQIDMITRHYQDRMGELLEWCGVQRVEDIPMQKASEIISKIMDRGNQG